MTLKKLFIVLIISLFLISSVSAQQKKVLFIGNSYTFGNNLPEMLKVLCASQGVPMETVMLAPGGCSLRRHVEHTGALDKISQEKWDYVILQDHSLGAIIGRDDMFKYGAILVEAVKKQGAQPFLYETWPREHIQESFYGYGEDEKIRKTLVKKMSTFLEKNAVFTPGFLEQLHSYAPLKDGIHGAYAKLAQDTGAQVVPVGTAWVNCVKAPMMPKLYTADKSHASVHGTYLTACVFYAKITGKSPEGLPATLRWGKKKLADIPVKTAKKLQKIAADVTEMPHK